MERLLEDVAAHGWSPERREVFVRRYDRVIGQAVLDLLVEYGLLADRRALRSLKSYIESRLQDQRAGAEHPLWEIVEEVYMRTYREIFEKKLIENYVRGAQAGAVQTEFEGYLRGAVRRRFLDVLGAGEKSEKELLDAIIESKKPNTIKQHIAEAKGRYLEKVRSYLLCTMTLSRQIEKHLKAVMDYFFERFIVERYPALRSQLKPGDSVLLKLLDAFVAECSKSGSLDERITRYVGEVPTSLPPYRRLVGLTQIATESDSESDEEALERAGAQTKTKDWAQPERLRWWDRLLRCQRPSEPELLDLRRLLLTIEDEAQRDTRLCLACVELKVKSSPEQRDDLRMFLVYYLSNYGATPDPEAQKENLTRETLCLETIRGRALSWEQIFKLFGRECNPTRVKSRIRQKFEAVQGGV